MADLTEALSGLGPIDFSSVPTSNEEQRTFLHDLFAKSELIVESVPIPDPTSAEDSQPYVASSAAEVKPSTARSAAPAAEHADLQKEWGKPLKLSAKENPLSISVYKRPAKDGKGAWFARRSVHEGIGFARFKKGLQTEFDESLATTGPPGTGNVRGIGGERRVEDIDVSDLGNISVYRLSAQFPGPTTPRDFVTCLVTSDRAMSNNSNGPRHYMILSKPCDHPDTQPTNDFIRGSYESVEFIREVPRTNEASMSAPNVASGHDGASTPDKETVTNNALPAADATARKVGSEDNPVEWIMVTRSDPGGSVPRFLVERGTPASIVADTSKFFDWACGKDFAGDANRPDTISQGNSDQLAAGMPQVSRLDSSRNGRSSPEGGVENVLTDRPAVGETATERHESAEAGGLVGAVTDTLAAYTPQVVLDHLPHMGVSSGEPQHATNSASQTTEKPPPYIGDMPDEARSIKSTTSFASADSHFTLDTDSDSPAVSTRRELSEEGGRPVQTHHHEKEIAKLAARRAALQNKFSASREKMVRGQVESSAKGEAAQKKAAEKHERDLKKHEQKYAKELQKIEKRQAKERKKIEERKRRAADKDEKQRLTRERDTARAELMLAKQEADTLRKAVERLQDENTALVVQLGRAGLGSNEIIANTTATATATATANRGVNTENVRAATTVGAATADGEKEKAKEKATT